MKTFNDLKKINVNAHIEKKGGLSYLSWAWAVDTLLEHDPLATWEFSEPKTFGKSVMVFCSVTAFGKTMKMHLPVMDNRNNAIMEPDARKISDAMMRCLAKCIACFGIGLYIYAGEDLPEGDSGNNGMVRPNPNPHAARNNQPSSDDGTGQHYTHGVSPLGKYKITFGKKYLGKTLEEIPLEDLASYVLFLEDSAAKKERPMDGKAKELAEISSIYIASIENGGNLS